MVGGYTPEKIALRRAIGMGYDVNEFIRVILKGRAVPATSPIPPDIAGYDPQLKTSAQLYDPAAARALLDRFGYKDRDGDGYREMPDGKPLVLERWSAPTSLDATGRRAMEEEHGCDRPQDRVQEGPLQELRKMARQGKMPMRTDGWNADYPDAENFMQLLYGPNVGQENHARFSLPEFDKLYDAAHRLPDSPERTRLFDRMTELVRRVRALAADGAPDRGSSAAAVDPQLQAASGPVRDLALPRHRSGATSEIRRNPR